MTLNHSSEMADSDQSNELRALVVDDEREVADAYALRLRGVCDVDTAYSGEAALSLLEDTAIDIVLLDRHMPDMSGDEVLAQLDEAGYYGRVVMVTAVDPDFDVLELPFDEYLCKPVDKADIHSVIDQQRRILAYETLGAYFSAASTCAVLEAETSPATRENHAEYTDLAERADRLEKRARRLLDDHDILDEFKRIGREEA